MKISLATLFFTSKCADHKNATCTHCRHTGCHILTHVVSRLRAELLKHKPVRRAFLSFRHFRPSAAI